jgi:Ca-activated chloride channel homolog
VFVLDASGSMSGTKLMRVKSAMIEILDDLHPTDTFNIVSFGTDIRYFNNESCVLATSANVGNAKTFISSLEADGGEQTCYDIIAAYVGGDLPKVFPVELTIEQYNILKIY